MAQYRPASRPAGVTSAGGQARNVAQPIGTRRLGQILEGSLVTLFVFAYFGIRGLMHGQEAQAFVNADKVIRLEQRLGIFWEPSIHSLTLQSDFLTNLANWIYIWGHWPVIAGTLIWLLWRHRSAFAVYRNAMLLSGMIGLVIFATFPLAPPRFLPELGFVDTVLQRSESYRVLQPPSLANLYAAMPSLHVGWNLLMGIAIARHAAGFLPRLFGLLMPPAMYLSTVATANHYLVDGLAGSAIAVTALLIVSYRGWAALPGLRMLALPSKVKEDTHDAIDRQNDPTSAWTAAQPVSRIVDGLDGEQALCRDDGHSGAFGAGARSARHQSSTLHRAGDPRRRRGAEPVEVD